MVKTNIQTFTGEVEVLEEFYVGSNLVANDVATHVLTVNNTANDAKIKSDFFVGDGGLLSNIATTLQSIADQGNAASNVILFNSNTDVTGYKNVGFVTTSNVGIQNTAPTHTMSIGDKIIIDNNTDESQGESVMLVHGRISADRFQGDGGLLSNIATTLESIADQGNASSNVLIFNSNTDISGYRGVGFVTTSNVGIQNTNPGFNTLSVGSNLFVNIYGSNVLTVHGNAAVSNLLVSEFSVSPAHGLQHVTQEGRATNQTVQLTNTTTGLEVSSNINVAGEVILTNATKGLDVTSNIEIGGRLKFDTNVFVDTLRVADVAANIVTYDRTTGELLDSSGTFMNKFAVVSEQPPSDFFANTTTVTNHGGYTLTTSNLATNSNTYNAFDGTANAWVSGDLAGGYIGGSNVFLETNLTQLSNLHPTQFGDWLAIEFPYKTTLRHMKLTPLTAAQFPASANIYATNNDLTWTEINYWSGRNPVTASNVQTIVVNATEQFKKYALVATKAAGDSSNVALQDWQLFTESFSIDGGKVAMAQQAATGGETVMDQHGPHSRDPKAVPLKKYPEIAFEEGKFDSNDSTNTYIQAGYTVSTDSVYQDRQVYRAFDGIDVPAVGFTYSSEDVGGNGFVQASGLPVSGVTFQDENGTSYTGHYIKLELPKKIKLNSVYLSSRNQENNLAAPNDKRPTSGTFLGSNDGTNWTLLRTFNDGELTWSSSTFATNASFHTTNITNIVNDGYFSYIMFLIEKIKTTNAYGVAEVTELEYYGYEEDPPAGDTSVDTTFTSIMNTPQTTGAHVYVDGSLGGNANTNRVVGPAAANTAATYDTTGKYWELNGTLTSNISVEANTFLSGDAPHSLSMWFNSSNLVSNASNSCIFSLGTEERLDHVSAAFSNTYQTVQKLLSSDLEANDRFGFAVSMSSDGTKFIVGAYVKDDDVGNIADVGAAYIYTYNGSSWDEQKLLSPDNEASSRFGFSVSMNSDGTKVIVGASLEDEGGVTNTGAAYIYTYSGGYWDAGTKIVAPDKAQDDYFGYSVGMSGDGTKVIVGAYIEDHDVAGGNTLASAGSAYIFTYTGSSWGTGTKIVASDRAASDIFGRSVAINSDGTKVIVGADGGEAAYIYTYNGSSWVEQILVASDAAAGDKFGYTVAMNSGGTKVIVGAYLEDAEAGAAYIYTYNGSSWDTGTKIVAPDKEAGDRLGISAEMNSDGTKVIVGAYKEHADGITDAGAAYIFAYDGSNWDTGLKITAPDKEASDQFSSDKQGVAMSGDGARVVVGSPLDDVFSANSGAVYVYDRDTTHHLTTDLDLQSNTWHNLTYAYQGEGGSRVTYLDGRKVAEDQAEDTFGEYPPFAMTGYSQGGYVASASGELSSTDNSHNLFDKDISNNSLWTPSASGYNSSTGAANSTGSITLTNGVQGHWVQLDLPHKLKLNYVGVAASSIGTRYAKDATIFGSNDGVSWTSVGGWTDNAHASNTLKYFTMNGDSGYYNKYRMVITKNGPDAALTLTEWKLYGHRENDLVRLPDPTNVLKYPRRAINASHSAGDNKYINRFDEVSTTSEYSTLGGTYSLVKAFDNVDGTSSVYWSASKRNSISGNLGRYASGAHGAYNGETPTGKSFIPSNATTAQKGEWIKMKSHHKLKLNKIELLSLGTDHKLVPSGVLIWGSDDDSNWNLLKTHVPSGTGGAVTYSNRLGVITVNSTVAYKYHAMVMTHMNNSDSNYTLMSMSQMKFFGTEEDISIPLQIGGGNIDKVANFRVYDKFVGEDQALEIWDAQKDEFGRAKSSMTLQKGRLGIGTDEPQGRLAVADEPHGVEEFPPRAMTGYKNYFEGHGEFCVSANSYGAGSSTTRYPWKAFIKGTTESTSNGDNSWLDGSGDFNNATGVYDGSLTHHNGSVSGEYLQLELPYEIQLSSYSLAPWNYPTGGNFQYSDFPRDFIIYGSKDSISWDIVDTRSGQSSTSQADVPKYHVNSQKTYKYFVIVVTKINTAAYANSAVYVAIGEWRLFGTREQGQSVLHDGQLTLTKSLTVPRIGPALDADDTPRRDRLVVEYNTSTNPTFEGAVRDTSGRGLDGVFYGGVSYDATEKALVFDGTNDYVQTNSPSSLSQIHSMSAWIKMDSQTGINSIMHIGTFDTYKESRIFTSGNVLHATIFGSTVAANSNGMTPSRWYHVVYTFVGGTFNTTNVKLFINGTSVTLTQTQTAATSALTGKTITIGSVSTGGEYFKGDISNPKLYDTALTAEEAKTLYDMGRCDEGHHVVNFSKTRVGIGLGDGEAPLAMLDSRDTRLAFKYGGTTLDNFEEYVHGGPWVGHHSNGSGGFNVHGPIKYQRIGTFCRAHFDFVQYYANGTFYMKADNVPERFRPVTGGDIMTWYTRVYTNGPISSLTYYDPGNTRWVITASVNGSNFNGGNGTNHSIISTSITYRVA